MLLSCYFQCCSSHLNNILTVEMYGEKSKQTWWAKTTELIKTQCTHTVQQTQDVDHVVFEEGEK